MVDGIAQRSYGTGWWILIMVKEKLLCILHKACTSYITGKFYTVSEAFLLQF